MSENMAWIDIETTGLDPIGDAILEVGLMVTDSDLNAIAERSWVVDPGSKAWCVEKMDDFVRDMHVTNGLLHEVNVERQGIDAWVVVEQAAKFLEEHGVAGTAMCGSSVQFDRAFLAANMRGLHDAFGYRNIDVSTLKELNKKWGVAPPYIHYGEKTHRALDDLRDSIAELAYYRKNLFIMGGLAA